MKAAWPHDEALVACARGILAGSGLHPARQPPQLFETPTPRPLGWLSPALSDGSLAPQSLPPLKPASAPGDAMGLNAAQQAQLFPVS